MTSELEKLVGIINNIIPGNNGILLTGSQRMQTSFIKEKDIDVVVFAFVPGNLVYTVLNQEGYLIDLTIFPLSDAIAILNNESYDIKGSLIGKLTKGVVLEDKSGIVQLIKDKATELYSKANFNRIASYREQIISLKKFRKYFSDKSNHQYSLTIKKGLLYDWYAAITTIQAFKFLPYVTGSFLYKHEILSKESPEFLNEVTDLVNKAGETSDYTFVEEYTLFYTNTIRNILKYEPGKDQDLIIDIGYDDFNLQDFALKILPIILSGSYLASAFKYFYASPLKYSTKYRYNVCVCFSLKDNIKYYKTYAALRSIVKDIEIIKNPRLSVVFEERSSSTLEQIDYLRKEINKYVQAYIQTTDVYINQPLINVLFKVLDIVRNNTSIIKADIIKGNACLMQNWIFSYPGAIRTTNIGSIASHYGKALRIADDNYKTKLSAFLPSVLQSGFYNIPLEFEGIDALILKVTNEWKKVENLERNTETMIMNQVYKILEVSDKDAVYYYVSIIEELFTFLNISYPQRVAALYGYYKALDAVQISTANEVAP